MKSSQPISLFTPQSKVQQTPTSYIVSALVHCGVVGLVLSGFLYVPPIDNRAQLERFDLHRIDLDQPDLQKYLGGHSGMYPTKAKADVKPKKALGAPAAPAASRPDLAQPEVKQTLIQPDIQPEKILKQTLPVPAMVLWTPPAIKVRTITPPAPKIANTAELKPNLEMPNHETDLSDLAVTSSEVTPKLSVMQPSNTTPIELHQSADTVSIPETASVTSKLATGAAVLSVSNLQMAKGTVVLPGVNEVAKGPAKGTGIGTGDPDSEGTGTGKGGHGEDSPDQTGKGAGKETASAGNGHGQDGKNGAGKGSGSGPAAGQGNGPGSENGRTYAKITLPKNGHFGVVVVGSNLSDDYPETALIWSGRLTYSAFLHVGMAKNWIMQYSLPRTKDAASGGTTNRLQAPWPYFVVRPNLQPEDLNGNALMIHGFVTSNGHLDTLSVIFPQGFAQVKFVLDALRQWQFRPAKENGQPARVEVLIIIPGEDS